MSKLEVIPAKTAEFLERRKANIEACVDGMQAGEKQIQGNAFLAGLEMKLAKAHVPHGNKNAHHGDTEAQSGEGDGGGFQDWIEANFPAVTYRTAVRWMHFSAAVLSSVRGDKNKSDTVSFLLKVPDLLENGDVNARDRQEILDSVPQITGGKSMAKVVAAYHASRITHHEPTEAEQLAAELLDADRETESLRASINLYLESDGRKKVKPAVRDGLLEAALRLTADLRKWGSKKGGRK